MSNPRKSFIVHIDSLDVLDELTDAECGELFRAIKAHHKQEEFKTTTVVRIAFSQFKGQFNRDQAKWEKVAESNRANGLKGGRPKGKKANPDKPNGLIGNPDNPNEGVSVSGSVSVSANVSVSKNEVQKKTTLSSKHDDAAQILNYLNSKRASDYKPTKSNIGLITARLNEGFSTEDIIRVIDNKIIEWGGSRKMEKYIRPSTLFNATKFSQYAGEPAQDAEDDFSWAMTREEAKAAKAANGPNVIDGDFKHA